MQDTIQIDARQIHCSAWEEIQDLASRAEASATYKATLYADAIRMGFGVEQYVTLALALDALEQQATPHTSAQMAQYRFIRRVWDGLHGRAMKKCA